MKTFLIEAKDEKGNKLPPLSLLVVAKDEATAWWLLEKISPDYYNYNTISENDEQFIACYDTVIFYK